ncbi:aconitate hydratase AcnA [Bradyrhizobium sp. LHD-71]|uniref:aconitate hydratase AcnA n=1 Tax=Bradyrhizobium sp. LHD-71 TaxID=3072141 RepID=UPI00280C62D6|nr:aconitate hydratase AcnA [Bradyrhizobium sp. LHD-71]MDQ8730443.1 aconitate hydratase AcnA [Bradyrhizobium sp. LHD-71]
MKSLLSEVCERKIDLGFGREYRYFSLPALEEAGYGAVSHLPLSLRVVLESLVRHCDGRRVTERQVRDLASWQPRAVRESELPFTVGRIVLNCAAGIPLLGDLTALRGAISSLGRPVREIGPKVPVDMVLDHTLTVDFTGTPDALSRNMELEISRNVERFRFVKWAMQAYDGIRLFPPGAGILHQVNLEFLARGVLIEDGVVYPDSLVGTDSHTCMIAGLGVVGWGVGGIEAEASALAQPYYMLTPDVVGVNVMGALRAGVTSTDLVLHVTETLRRHKVVGKFVEFFGEGVASLSIPDRATISNMAPEYGATIGYFPVDEQTCRYLTQTGRSPEQVKAVEAYFRAQGAFGAPKIGEVDYTSLFDLDLADVTPNLAGPKRPQDRLPLAQLRHRFNEVLRQPLGSGGYGKAAPVSANGPRQKTAHGDVVIAAITSCTNTSNPTVMVMAGLVAQKAVARGLTAKPWVKTSLTPGSRVVSKYLDATGLQASLDQLGFAVAGYSCGTCVGASGPIDPVLERAIVDNDVVACAVLSGNRNFEARIHPAVRAAFLASPPLVLAFAIAGTVDIDMEKQPLGHDVSGNDVYLRDVWPTQAEIDAALAVAERPEFYREIYGGDLTFGNPAWSAVPQPGGDIYPWEARSDYIKEPPFLASEFRHTVLTPIKDARALAMLGDSVTTDHISPIGGIKSNSPAGTYLRGLGVQPIDFNNYGARRMNHEVMVRGGFSNVRLKNLMLPGTEGGLTAHQPSGDRMSIYDAAMRYKAGDVPLIVIAGEEYGTGSARDWAAKATRLLGVRAVIAQSFERIHRSNLVGMGVLPCQFVSGQSAASWNLTGEEEFDVLGLDDARPRQPLTLVVRRRDGTTDRIQLVLRLDTPIEIEFARQGGIMPYVLSELAGVPA